MIKTKEIVVHGLLIQITIVYLQSLWLASSKVVLHTLYLHVRYFAALKSAFQG